MAERIHRACDYLVIGAGASGMSFVDTLLANAQSCTFLIIDKQGQPGGHWLKSYRFVKLHGPAAYYGVPSTVLKTTSLSPTELATGAEILDYYKKVEYEVFAPTGRVQFLFNCTFDDKGRVRNLETGEEVLVNVRKRIVDTTYANIQVPLTHTPSFSTARGVQLVPPHSLPDMDLGKFQTYVVVGGGKTAMDAVLWMLEVGIQAKAVVWIRPRESWLSPRDHLTPEGYPLFMQGIVQACVDAETVDEAFELMEQRGFAYRLDPCVMPTMHKGATVSLAELHALRKVKNVIAGQGRVRSIEQDRVVLARGQLEELDCKTTLYVDCSAEAFEKTLSGITIFDHQRITLQFLGGNTSTLSAAQIGMVESTDLADTEKNELCYSVKQQTTPSEWLIMQYSRLKMTQRWDAYPQLAKWLSTCRLNTFTHVAPDAMAECKDSYAGVCEAFIRKMESGWQGLL